MGLLKFLKCGSISYSLLIKRPNYKQYYFFHSSELFRTYHTRIIYKMNSVYFQCSEDKEYVLINFNYSENNINFTFQRPISECMEKFLSRVQQKLVEKLTKKKKKKKKPYDESENEQVDVSLLLNNEIVPNEVKFQDIFQNDAEENLTLRINDTNYDVFLNFPTVLKLTLPASLFAGTTAFPDTLETQFTDENESEYVWFKSKRPAKLNSWEKCGEGFFYFTKEEDIGFYLKIVCTPKLGKKVGPVYETVSTETVKEFKACEEIKKRHEFTKNRTQPDEFRIVSYNILANVYTQTKEAKTELFTFCDPAYLESTYRKTLCIVELLGYNADIICLQEVDRSQNCTLDLLFSRKDYNCLYCEKEAAREGCMLLYNKNKFNILSERQFIILKELFTNSLLDDIKVKIQENEKLMSRMNGISSGLQVVILENSLKHVLIVGNTHFYFHPDADHIRLLQGVLSWRILQNIYEETKKKEPNKKCSIILCGDLNSTPDSGFHQLLTEGFVGEDHIGWKSKEDEVITNLQSQQLYKMKSAYDNTKYTNFTPLFKGCLDYIYYQTDHLKLKQNVPIPSEEVLSQHTGIPSEFFPSDHVALVADLKFQE